MSDDTRPSVVNNADRDKDQLMAGLSLEERRKLTCPPQVSGFQRDVLERNAKKNWDLFYKRNGDRFFKKRYWTRHEFAELFNHAGRESTGRLRYLLEIGCGCGDFVLPLLDNEPEKFDEQKESSLPPLSLAEDLYIYCCDISEKAIEILRSNAIYKRFEASRISAFAGNLLDLDGIVSILDGRQMDYVSLIFVLSALDPRNMKSAIHNVAALLAPGGLVFFRDYAICDKAMLKFNESNKIEDQFYVRQDGTRAYFFTRSELADLFSEASFECQSIEYVKRTTINKATDQSLSRVFLQAKFRKGVV